jgi:cation diffusion facilitator family transporter
LETNKMADCCEDKACAIDALQARQGTTLRIVLWINAVMFFVELAGGIISGSVALLSDSLDNLGDALTYGLSLYAVSRGARAKAKVSIFKGALILGAGLFVFGQALYQTFFGALPVFEAMGLISLLALAANGTCLALLWKHRDEDINMASVWECSRNDIASNLSVFVAAGAVWVTESRWPDLLVGYLLAAWFLRSAIRVLKAACLELNNTAPSSGASRRETSSGSV